MAFDFILVGGGLQSGLIALAVRSRSPGARIAVVEQLMRFGGEHTWCFHEGDVPSAEAEWVEPLVTTSWSSWDVRFPTLTRTFDLRYAAITSARLHDVVASSLARHEGSEAVLGHGVRRVDAHAVELDDGRVLEAPLVIDARGPELPPTAAGYQKFVGVELALSQPCDLTRPLVMDASVEQVDGFRFFYMLPFTPTRVLVEETFFSDEPSLDEAACTTRALAYARSLGLVVSHVARTERGVLPLPLTTAFAPARRSPMLAGYRGGWFHPTTGYSLPVAVRLAAHVAATPLDAMFGATWDRMVADHARQSRFAVMLNRLLFSATAPSHRRDVLERFHRLPDASVQRFYALASSPADRLRILCGAPPRGVSLRRAIGEVMSS